MSAPSSACGTVREQVSYVLVSWAEGRAIQALGGQAAAGRAMTMLMMC